MESNILDDDAFVQRRTDDAEETGVSKRFEKAIKSCRPETAMSITTVFTQRKVCSFGLGALGLAP